MDPTPIFRIEVVARTTQAVNYLHRGGSTRIDFQGTPLMAVSRGSATVESQRGVIHVAATFKNMNPPSSFGPEYLTYVLWAISPDGRPVNLGELTLDHYGAGSESKIEATSDIQTFGMIVTAEPYYAVTQPSDVVVMENVVRPDTRGVVESVNARFELLPRGMYTHQSNGRRFSPVFVDKKNPFELYEAMNAVQLAQLAGADRYASESFQQAADALEQAKRYQTQKPGQKPVITMAREAAVRAEDARVVALRKMADEAQENERLAALARENAERDKAEGERKKAEIARLKADEERQQRERAEADRMAAERARADAQAATQDAQRQTREAERLRLAAEQDRTAAEAAKQAALEQQRQLAMETDRARAAAADADRLRADADRLRQDADRQRQQAEQEKADLRKQLLEQFNLVLQTRDTARGLIVNMSDVLFDFNKYTLRPGAREKLAKVSGIILGHPGLKIAVEGHTDSIGSEEYNMKLSENRASAVREYLAAQGINPANLSSRGFGKTLPVADNSTAAGRQANRRVELVVSGEIIGTTITSLHSSSNH